MSPQQTQPVAGGRGGAPSDGPRLVRLDEGPEMPTDVRPDADAVPGRSAPVARRILLALGSAGVGGGGAWLIAEPGAVEAAVLLVASVALVLGWAGIALRSRRRDRDRAATAAASLAAARRRLVEILDGIEDGITVHDESGRLLYANEAAARSMGFDSAEALLSAGAEEILSRYEILDERGSPFPLDELPGRRTLRGEPGTGVTLRYRDRASGGERWSYVRATSLGGDRALPKLAVNVIQDVTEERWDREASTLLAQIGGQLLGSSLDFEGTLRRLAEMVVPRLADLATVSVGEGSGIRRVDVVHTDPQAEILIRRRSEEADGLLPPTHPLHEVFASGKPQLFPEVTDEVLERVAIPELKALHITSMMLVPLTARRGPVGALKLAMVGGRHRYDERDLAVVMQLAARAAVAVENAALHEQEQRARRQAEDTAERLARLQALTADLSGATTVEEVTEAVLGSASEALGGAVSGSIVLREANGGGSLRLVKAIGLSEEDERRWRSIPVDAPLPLAEAARTGASVFIGDLDDLSAAYPHLVGPGELQGKAWAALPLPVEDRVLGAIGLVFPEPREFPVEERRFLEIVGQQCAQALERAALYEGEAEARAEAVRQQERLNFLAEASEILGGSLRYERTLEHLLDLCVPRLADWCIVDVEEADGTIRQLAAAHADPEKTELIRELRRRYPPDLRDHPIPRVIKTGTPEVAEITDEMLRANVENEENRRMLLELGARAHMVVPLPARGRIVGALSFISGTSGRTFSQADLGLAEELARRAGLALDNARLYRERSRVAHSLQQSLLPRTMPDIPGAEVATRYRSAEGSDVGGDFYDVFETGRGRWGFVIGDVSGRGPEAAAMTALTRHTIRTAWREEQREPADVLRILNDAILQEDAGRFCTVALGRLDLSGSPSFTVATGGHAPPLVLRSDGSVEAVEVRGMLVGAFPDPDIGQHVAGLRPGDALVLYTDGVVDAGRPSQIPREERLAEILRLCVGLDADLIARRVERHASTFESSRDDAALLVLRILP